MPNVPCRTPDRPSCAAFPAQAAPPRRLAAVILAALLFLAPAVAAAQEPLRIAHADWSSSQASAWVVAEALRADGHRVTLQEYAIDEAWDAVAHGDADVLFSAWLPSTHAPYWDRFGSDLTDLGPNLEGTRTGLAVPDVGGGRQTGGDGQRGAGAADLESISDLADRWESYGRVIVGIEPEAGVMRQAREALEVYGLDGYELLETGSEEAMLRRLADAVRTGTPIVITGWVPLWANARWNLRFLDDPEGTFGGSEAIHTLIRPGLRDDAPDLVEVLDRFAWSAGEMERVMIWMQDDATLPGAAARRWLQANPATVEGWFAEP
ncbi:MAG: glycine betaine ABC transporter substrate-binding protein [Trueperaceae bacterium]